MYKKGNVLKQGKKFLIIVAVSKTEPGKMVVILDKEVKEMTIDEMKNDSNGSWFLASEYME
jgi:nitrate reductase NapAB chaperone NapD